MSVKTFRKCVYVVIVILISLFFTKDIPFFESKFYQDIKEVSNPDDILVLVNKRYKLPPDYSPADLEPISEFYSYQDKQVRSVVKEAFESLSEDAMVLGYRIIASSAYRDYNYQDMLYQGYVKEKGLDYADMCSARPGHSEHQTGLSIDVTGSNLDYNLFEESNEFEWMRDNAHLYGFIMRYPKNKEHITGFKYEPWHYRYVGVEVATEIYENDLTLEEYLEKK